MSPENVEEVVQAGQEIPNYPRIVTCEERQLTSINESTRAELLELRYQSKPASFHDRKMTVHKGLSPTDLLMVWCGRADLVLS
jgi:hypothetical protein